jgi:hypothetical protein
MSFPDALIGPLAALLGTALGAWLLDRYSGKRWLQQQQWAAKQKYYGDLLQYLTKAEMALQAQSEYYMEPASEHRDYSGNAHFMKLGSVAAEALHSLQELTGPAQVFLSSRAMDALKNLVREDWNASFSASHTGEYVENALPLVQAARAAVVAEAKTELVRT